MEQIQNDQTITVSKAPVRNIFDLLSMIFALVSYFIGGGIPLSVAAIIMSVIGTNKNGTGRMHPMSVVGRLVGIFNICLIAAAVIFCLLMIFVIFAFYVLLIFLSLTMM